MRVSLFIFITLFISGCDKPKTQQTSTIGNQAVNCLRVNLGISNTDLMERVTAKKKTYDLDSLKRIHLPENASLCERRDFVDLILYVSQNQANYMQTDPQVNMIKLAISGYEEEFLSLAKDWHTPNSYVVKALVESLSDENKKTIVQKNITKHPWLIKVVIDNRWSLELRQEIESIISQRNGKVNYNYAAALAQIDDPKNAELLRSIFRGGNGNRHVTYTMIKDVEWFDAYPVLEEIWVSEDVSNLEQQYLAYPLLRNGFMPVLDYLVNNINGYSYNSPYQKNYQALNAITGQNLSEKEIQSWVTNNRHKLKFDIENKQYYISPDA